MKYVELPVDEWMKKKKKWDTLSSINWCWGVYLEFSPRDGAACLALRGLIKCWKNCSFFSSWNQSGGVPYDSLWSQFLHCFTFWRGWDISQFFLMFCYFIYHFFLITLYNVNKHVLMMLLVSSKDARRHKSVFERYTIYSCATSSTFDYKVWKWLFLSFGLPNQ